MTPLLLLDTLLPAAASDASRGAPPSQDAAWKADDCSLPDPPVPEQDRSLRARRTVPRTADREAPTPQGVRERLGLRAVNPESGSRLDYCVEFTKPDSLKVRLTGMPKSHRSPPRSA